MIETTNVTKRFGNITAVDHISATIREENVFGLIGTNGAGKSTFLRLLCGIYKPDEGEILIDGNPVFERPDVKASIFYISNDQFFPGSTPMETGISYSRFFPAFDLDRYKKLLGQFDLDPGRKISTFSKGMKKQISILCGICAGTRYLFCDETFDGLDPVMRQAVKSLFASELAQRGLTPVIASHSLRELEDICDHVGLLHRGGILLSRELVDMKLNIHKLQFVLKENMDESSLFAPFEVLKLEKRGSLRTATIRGSREMILSYTQSLDPLFYELLPLTLEEIFISETEVAGYDIQKVLF